MVHSHGLLCLFLSISCLLLSLLLDYLGLFLHLREALTAHLLGPQALLSTQLEGERSTEEVVTHSCGQIEEMTAPQWTSGSITFMV